MFSVDSWTNWLRSFLCRATLSHFIQEKISVSARQTWLERTHTPYSKLVADSLRGCLHLHNPICTEMFIPIHYGSFWHAPISFITEYEERVYLFTRYGFDEEIDDYPENYDVFIIGDIPLADAVNKKLWYSYNFKNKAFIGTVPFYDVIFDSSRRKFVHTSVFQMIERSTTGRQSKV